MSTLSGHHRHIGITMQSPSAASRPNIGEVTYVLYFVSHRATVDEFDASLPSHGGPNQAVMYSVKKQLTSTAPWF